MQTPAGYKIVNGKIEVESWMAVIFNPSMPYRLTHMVMASLISATFVVAGISAYYLLKKKYIPFAKKGLSMCMWFALVLTPLQAWIGDMHGLNVQEHQPVKLAAMEGIWPAEEDNVPLLLFAMPNMETESNDYQVGIPNLGSVILTHSWDGAVQGLKSVPPEDRPYVPLVFWSFRIMVGIGFGMLGIAILALVLRRKDRLFTNKAFLSLVTLFTPAGVIAVLFGWYVAEVGRQPLIVYNLVRTADIVSPLPAERVLFTLIMFVIIYTLLLGVYLYFMCKLIKKGPPTMGALEQQLVGMKAPGYALAWVKNLQSDSSDEQSSHLSNQPHTKEQGDK
jgi:cytochrome d ubiquinol oxidase subunit I